MQILRNYRHWKIDAAIVSLIAIAALWFWARAGIESHIPVQHFEYPDGFSYDSGMRSPSLQWVDSTRYLRLDPDPYQSGTFHGYLVETGSPSPQFLPALEEHLSGHDREDDLFVWKISPDAAHFLTVYTRQGKAFRKVIALKSGKVSEYSHQVLDDAQDRGYGLRHFSELGWFLDSTHWYEVSDGGVLSIYALDSPGEPVWRGGSMGLSNSVINEPLGRVWRLRPLPPNKLIGLWKNHGPYRPQWRQFYPDATGDSIGIPLVDNDQWYAVDTRPSRWPNLEFHSVTHEMPLTLSRRSEFWLTQYQVAGGRAMAVEQIIQLRQFFPILDHQFSADYQNIVLYRPDDMILLPLPDLAPSMALK